MAIGLKYSIQTFLGITDLKESLARTQVKQEQFMATAKELVQKLVQENNDLKEVKTSIEKFMVTYNSNLKNALDANDMETLASLVDAFDADSKAIAASIVSGTTVENEPAPTTPVEPTTTDTQVASDTTA